MILYDKDFNNLLTVLYLMKIPIQLTYTFYVLMLINNLYMLTKHITNTLLTCKLLEV